MIKTITAVFAAFLLTIGIAQAAGQLHRNPPNRIGPLAGSSVPMTGHLRNAVFKYTKTFVQPVIL